MAQHEGGAAGAEQPGDEQDKAARQAAARAKADAAIAAIAGGRAALAAMARPVQVTEAAIAKRSPETDPGLVEDEDAGEAADQVAEASSAGPSEESAPETEFEDSSSDEEFEGAAASAPAAAHETPVEREVPAARETPAAAEPAPAPQPAVRAAARTVAPAELAQEAAAAPGPVTPPPGDPVARWMDEEGAPAEFRRRLWAAFGEGAEAAGQLTANPWLVLELSGVRPGAADNLARLLLGLTAREQALADPRRSRALVTMLLRHAARAGHTAAGADEIAAALAANGVADPSGAIADAVEHGAALVFADRVALAARSGEPGSSPDSDAEAGAEEEFEALDTADDDAPETMLTSPYTLLALDQWTFVEQSGAEAAQRLLATARPLEAKSEFADVAGDAAEAERLRRVVDAAAGNGLTLVTGAGPELPGRVAAAFPGAVLACPSPAGLRTLAGAGFDAVDLRALDGHADELSAAEVVVVAQAQSLPLELGANLLELLGDGTHLVLCGDTGTLPASGPGRLFRDLGEIDDPEFGGAVPAAELKQRPSGPLTALVDAIRYGGLPPMEILGDAQSTEVKIIPVRDPAETRLRTVQLMADSIPRALGFQGTDVQGVALREKGPAGAEDLNAAVKERLNPGPGVCGGFDAGDRVVVREGAGLAEAGLYGGETGLVTEAGAAGLTVTFDAPHAAEPLRFAAEQARALRHAWILTVREAQGGRWPAVVAILDGGSAAALTRAAVLGAFTPAVRHLSVVHGAGPALAEAVEKRPHTPCRTRLAQALRG